MGKDVSDAKNGDTKSEIIGNQGEFISDQCIS